MKMNLKKILIVSVWCISANSLFAQNANCFLDDFAPKAATIPVSVVENKTTSVPASNFSTGVLAGIR